MSAPRPARWSPTHGDGRVYATNHLESDNGAAAINSQTDQFLYYYSRLHATQGRYGIAVDPGADKLFIAARDAGLIAIQDAYLPRPGAAAVQTRSAARALRGRL